ncbi:transcription factor bHLH92-like [Primulina tabacum]|uniref:transcription factor bHLH92-like n=1 Tax=Primulina tabacum TaxID=48773 RepID=UPI003F59B88E
MDEFLHLSPGSMLWLQEVLSMNNKSAFLSYTNTNEPLSKTNANGSTRGNVNKRMIQFLKKNWTTQAQTGNTSGETDRGRGRGKKHVIRERLRREIHKRFYGALHELLPPGTKSDQKSILEMTIKKIKELQDKMR